MILPASINTSEISFVGLSDDKRDSFSAVIAACAHACPAPTIRCHNVAARTALGTILAFGMVARGSCISAHATRLVGVSKASALIAGDLLLRDDGHA